MTSGTIERASAIDMMERATATTPAAGQVGAVLLFASARCLELDIVRSALADRISGVPRLRQRLRSVPFACGRPIWVDDPSFDIADHVNEVRCPSPGDRTALFAVVSDVVVTRLPPERPLWSATLVTGLTDGATALVLVFHHVMALFADAMRSRLRSLVHFRHGIRRVRDAGAELGTSRRTVRAPRCSLNGPVGPRRCLSVAQTDLHAIHAAARQHGASVNDAVLAAITGALRMFLSERGEDVAHFGVSIPVSGRQAATATRLGNDVGVMAVMLPATGTAGARMEAIAAITRARKQAPGAASATILAPALRVLAATRTLNWMTRHQRMVTTFVTNLRGPESRVAFLEAPVTEIIPVSGTSGNVRVAFGVLSDAGTLTVTVVADHDLAGELASLVALLQTELERVGA